MCITKLGNHNLHREELRGSTITKTGQDTLPKYIWRGLLRTKDFIKNVPTSWYGRAGKSIGSANAGVVSKYMMRPAVKGTAAAGKFLYRHPTIAIPGLAMGYVGYRGIADNYKKNMFHVDPKYNITRSNALGQIVYNDPRQQKNYEQLPFTNI